jgi:hypothetical protein
MCRIEAVCGIVGSGQHKKRTVACGSSPLRLSGLDNEQPRTAATRHHHRFDRQHAAAAVQLSLARAPRAAFTHDAATHPPSYTTYLLAVANAMKRILGFRSKKSTTKVRLPGGLASYTY